MPRLEPTPKDLFYSHLLEVLVLHTKVTNIPGDDIKSVFNEIIKDIEDDEQEDENDLQ